MLPPNDLLTHYYIDNLLLVFLVVLVTYLQQYHAGTVDVPKQEVKPGNRR